MAPQPEICPLVFCTRAPKGITSADFCKDLVQRFNRHGLASVQDFGGGRFEVSFKTMAVVEQFLIDHVVRAKELEMRLGYHEVRPKVVRVFG